MQADLVSSQSVESGLEPTGKVLDGVEEERQQGVLHLAVELLLDGLGQRPAVLILVRLPDARHLRRKFGQGVGGRGQGGLEGGGYPFSGIGRGDGGGLRVRFV